jgi:cleavage stimulation factor subunit 1
MFFFFYFSQLFYDGFPQLAVQLAKATNAHPSCPPSDRLMKVFSVGLKIEEGF